MTRSGTATAEPTTDTQPEAPAKPAKGKGKVAMSSEHKAALAEGREHGRIVRQYLDALEVQRPKRGRRVDPATIQERISEVEQEINSANAFDRLVLIQKKMDLETQLRRNTETVDLTELEQQFIQVAASYASKRGFTYEAFRQVGVSADVLKQAGIEK